MAEKHDKAEMAADKKMIAAAVHKHEKAKHKGSPLTKLKKGGVSSSEMKKYGRNMARAMNQRGSSRGG